MKLTYFGFLKENKNIMSYDELYDIAKIGLEGRYSDSGCLDDDDFDAAIKCAIDDFKLFLSIDYPIELCNIPKKPIIYRLIRLKNISDFDKDKLGHSWFSNPEQYKKPEFYEMLDYLKPFKSEQGIVYLIKAQTDSNNIDMFITLWERSTQWHENEIYIKDDSINSVEILSLTPLA